jgi:uncharacterized protein (DUF983 family)
MCIILHLVARLLRSGCDPESVICKVMAGIICGLHYSQMPPTLMESNEKPSALLGILRQCCPRCRVGKIFRGSIVRGFPRMYERCEVCNLKFEREPGYFLGAMYVSYGLALATIGAIAALLWSVTSWSIVKDIAWACLLFLPLAPWLTLFARVLWIYLDQTIDPERPA